MDDKKVFLKSRGIDVDVALSYLGDEELFNEVLLDFKNGMINQLGDIRVKYETNDMANYAILVHALKSNCKTLGIMSLADLAYNHEMKSKENDKKYIDENITALFQKANEVYNILDEYFKM